MSDRLRSVRYALWCLVAGLLMWLALRADGQASNFQSGISGFHEGN